MSRSTTRNLAWIAITALAWGAACSTATGGADVQVGQVKDDVPDIDPIDADAGQPLADAAEDGGGADTQGQDASGATDGLGTGDGGGQDIALDIPKTGDTSVGPGEQKELLVKILGPSGREWAQSEGAITQLSGVAFGGAETIAWTSSSGKTGTITPNTYWLSGIIELTLGDNTLTVTATKGDQSVTDQVHIVYNPLFSFEGPPDISPSVVFVNETSTLVVQVSMPAAALGSDGTSVVDPTSIKFIEVNQDGSFVSEKATLLDSGQGSNCDDVKGDSVYSTCVGFTPNEAKTVCFRVRSAVNIAGKKYDALSPVVCVDVVARFSKTECNAIVALQKKVKTDYAAVLAASGSTATAQVAAIEALKMDPSVAEAGPASANGYGVWVRYKTGRLGALSLAPAGNRSGGGAPQDAGAALPTYSVGTRRALALAPFNSEFKVEGAGDEAEQAGLALKAKQCPPFAVDVATGTNARLKWYREMSTYGLVAISGHGDVLFEGMDTEAKKALHWEHLGAQEVLWSGEPVDCAALSGQTGKCKQDGSGCPTGETCVKTSLQGGVCIDHTQGDIMMGRAIIGDSTYGLVPSFIQRHTPEPFPASIVYLGSCRSMYNASLAVQLWGNGVAAVVGYSDYVTNAFAYQQGWKFFDSLINLGQSALQSMSVAQEDPLYPGSHMRLLGSSGKANVNDASLINPSWDLGKLTGWSKAGDGRVVTRLGVTIPVAGKYMGIISTGLGFTAQNGSLSQPFCIPAAKTDMCFFWKFYSEEFIEYCGSSFMDRFTTTLQTDSGKKTLTDVWVDQLCPYDCGGTSPCEPGSSSCKCGQQWKTLSQADVGFDVGGVFMTPWQKTCQDITSLAGSGKKVDLKFFATDVGDSVFDTVILIDEVTVQ